MAPIAWKTNFNEADAVIEVLLAAADHCRTESHRDRSIIRLPRRGRLIATGDLHDNPFHLDTVIRLARLDASPDHHVFLHELIHGENLINGLDFSYRMLAKTAELKTRWPNQVHPLLANHELAQMRGESVTKGAGDCVQRFDSAIAYAFGPDAEPVQIAINTFLRALPVALVTDSGFLCAHSLPDELDWPLFDRTLFSRDLSEADYNPKTGSAYMMVWGRNHSPEYLDRLADAFNVKAFCLGHEHAEIGWQPLGRRTIILNSDHDAGVVLPIDLAADPDPPSWQWAVLPLRSLAE